MMKTHAARRRFGQNFLVDDQVIHALVALIHPQKNDQLVEIGPGLGALTRPLSQALEKLHVVEIDRDLVTKLQEEFSAAKLCIHAADALKFDFSQLGNSLRIVGNLPYNISTPLLFHLASFSTHIKDITVMLQKEVVERISAPPNSSAYGRLSVMLQYRFFVAKRFDVPAEAFRPIPQVTSSVITLYPKPPEQLQAHNFASFSAIVSAAFSQRRKMLRNTLSEYLQTEDFLQLAIDPQQRAQSLSVERYVQIANYHASAAQICDDTY
jgi:16S rRNA (adenine1518-N6/adenine1519-N6)-dimethyltransferase